LRLPSEFIPLPIRFDVLESPGFKVEAMNQPMPALSQRRPNRALWAGTALLLLTVLSSVPSLYALKGFDRILPWAGLVLPALTLVSFAVGLSRAFTMRQVYGGRIMGSILGAISLVLMAGSVWLFVHVRDLPASSGAPKIGQKAPAFTLTDASGNQVSLAQLLAPSAGSSVAPRAVLLVFYRGYW
jgi:hypothetical protein